ncbi:uncharacterized protein K444DRAFT_617802 [Hyaloscypha bicolor E]|uniref:Uncharacterized protein n=1 Tax=Hyaloscypha bicolor E TaxID=1095630 RepID=A0A2J6SXG5_9HELO|nr:uncharacterized protein K444DRAFT_617802 [Hyaloscypha bicolor E]PMD55363.1 hypothetical protein K444DRAFT_617802 [Hyaloscypha bicolor E]
MSQKGDPPPYQLVDPNPRGKKRKDDPPVNKRKDDPPPSRPPKGKKGKRYVHIWHCCACGKASIGILVESCPDCSVSRCPYCRTEKIRVQ